MPELISATADIRGEYRYTLARVPGAADDHVRSSNQDRVS